MVADPALAGRGGVGEAPLKRDMHTLAGLLDDKDRSADVVDTFWAACPDAVRRAITARVELETRDAKPLKPLVDMLAGGHKKDRKVGPRK